MSNLLALENDKSETALLGSILINPECIWDVKSVLVPGDFAIGKHRFIYDAALALSERGAPVDILTIVNEMAKAGHVDPLMGVFISELMSSTPSSVNALSYAETISDAARRRGLVKLGSDIVKRAHDLAEDVDKTVTWITSTASSQARGGEIRHAPEVVEAVYAEFENNMAVPLEPGEVRGLDTGWIDLNVMLGGWKPGFYVVLGEPHVGKSFFALHAAANIAERGGRALLFSLEMTAEQLVNRLCLAHAQLSQRDYDSGRPPDAAVDKYLARMAQIREWPLDIVDDMETTSAIFSTIHRECRSNNPPVFVVIDYMGLVVTDYRSENRNAELSELARSMKRVSATNQLPLLSPHQISDKAVAARKNKRPKKSDGYNSGGLSQHSDVMLGLYDESLHVEGSTKSILEVTKLKDRLSGGANPYSSAQLRFEKTGALRDFTSQKDPMGNMPEEVQQWEDKY